MTGGGISPVAVVAIVAVTLASVVVGARGLRVARTEADFLVAARQVSPLLNASAISGEYLSAASFLGVAGLMLKDGVGALWYPVGYAAGYLVLLLFVAAPLRRFGAYTLPDFAEGRLDSRPARLVATGFVLVIGWFYLLPQFKAAGLTLSVLLGTPYWVGVVLVGLVVTMNIAAGGMKGVTLVQAFLFWLKLLAIAIPAAVLLGHLGGFDTGPLYRPVPPVFAHATTVDVRAGLDFRVVEPVTVTARGTVDGVRRDGPLRLEPGAHRVDERAALTFPASSRAPHVLGLAARDGRTWAAPYAVAPGGGGHPLAATYAVILATFLGTIGLPHILVRFYTNLDGPAARRTTAIVLLMLGVFYLFPPVYGALGRLAAPGLYLTGATDAVALVLPRLVLTGLRGELLAALVAAGAVAAFLSTSSGLLTSVAGALSHDLLGGTVRAFRVAAAVAGGAAVLAGLAVARIDINVLVGWAFAIAASSFCPLLLLGIWWWRLTAPGAVAGLLAGGGAASLAVLTAIVTAVPPGWVGLLLTQPALWTVPLAFATMVGVSLATRGRLPADVEGTLLQLHLPEALRRLRRPAGRSVVAVDGRSSR